MKTEKTPRRPGENPAAMSALRIEESRPLSKKIRKNNSTAPKGKAIHFPLRGIPYPSYAYDNVWLLITPTSGTGILYGFGATANNTSNDPAAHIIDIHH